MPRAGGMYVWLSEAYGGLVGFLHGWAYFLVVATGAIAALAIVFAEYVGFFVPLGPGGTRAVALGALVVLAGVNVAGVRIAAAVGGCADDREARGAGGDCGDGDLGGVVVGCGCGVGVGVGGRAGVGGAGMIGVLWSYGGWQHASFAAGEAKRPERDVPTGMIVGTVIVTLAYVLANVAYVRLLPIDADREVAPRGERRGGGGDREGGGGVVAAMIAASALGTAGIFTMTTPRVYWAMAERGLFFKSVAELHPRWRTPVRAILLQTGWAVVLVLAWGTFEGLVSYVLFVDWDLLRARRGGGVRPPGAEEGSPRPTGCRAIPSCRGSSSR